MKHFKSINYSWHLHYLHLVTGCNKKFEEIFQK